MTTIETRLRLNLLQEKSPYAIGEVVEDANGVLSVEQIVPLNAKVTDTMISRLALVKPDTLACMPSPVRRLVHGCLSGAMQTADEIWSWVQEHYPDRCAAALATIKKRDREVLTRHRAGESFRVIGASLGISGGRASQLEYRAWRNLSHPVRMRVLQGLPPIENDLAPIPPPPPLPPPATIADVPLDHLEFSVRVANCLDNANIKTVGQLATMSKRELLKYRNFGKKSLNEVRDKLEEFGIGLKSGF